MSSIVTSTNLKQEVLDYPGTVLVDFWAPWCGPCQLLAPVIDEIASENQAVKVIKINVDEENSIAMQFNVTSIPTVIIFKQGKPVNTIVGFRQKLDYQAAL